MKTALRRTIFGLFIISITATAAWTQSNAFKNKTLAYYEELDRVHLNNFMDFGDHRIFEVKARNYSDNYSTAINDSMAKYGVVLSQSVIANAVNDYFALISSSRPLRRNDGFSIRMFVNRLNEIEFLDLGLNVDYKCKIDVPFEALSDFYYKISQLPFFADMRLPDEVDYLFVELTTRDQNGKLTLRPRSFKLLIENYTFQPKKLYDLLLPAPCSGGSQGDSFVPIEGNNYSKVRVTNFACLESVEPYDTRILPKNVWKDFERKMPSFRQEMRRDYDISAIDIGETGIRSKIAQSERYVVLLYDLELSQWNGVQTVLSLAPDDTVIDRLEVKIYDWNENHEWLTLKTFEIDSLQNIIVYDLQPALKGSYTPVAEIGDGLMAIPVISKYKISEEGKFKLVEQWKGEATYFELKIDYDPKEAIEQAYEKAK